jgi:hypothetical protein
MHMAEAELTMQPAAKAIQGLTPGVQEALSEDESVILVAPTRSPCARMQHAKTEAASNSVSPSFVSAMVSTTALTVACVPRSLMVSFTASMMPFFCAFRSAFIAGSLN